MASPKIALPSSGYQALIFDLDGTIVDSMPAHYKAWSLALADHGAPDAFPEDVFCSMGGLPTRAIIDILNREQGLTLDSDAIALSKKEHFLSCLDDVKFIDEVIDFVRANHGKVPMAVASGGGRVVVDKTLQVLKITDLFDAVVTANDVVNGKPAPDIFLEAASRLGVLPAGCVVFEDAPAGIEAAKAAGMEVVVVPTHVPIA
ncbi:HAD family phosphatase [Akkermansiaceae bacterium]|nr:HAD family phosphatase [Akkermansiaceae bacterium]MDB4412172.1 HAD family phosphatase [Akkermansiaceae bacterium]